MIITKLIGGLGNQMFQYAIGRSLATKNKTELKMDLSGYEDQSGIATPRQYSLGVFNIEENFSSPEEVESLKGKSRILKKLGIIPRTYLLERKPNFFDEKILGYRGDGYLEGYWQTEKYFFDIRDIVLKDFSLKVDLGREAINILEKIKNTKSVSLHIRRGDYVSDKKTGQFHGVCSLEYYFSAISYLVDKLGSDLVFFVFSDDIAWAKENLKLNLPVEFVSRDGIKDYEEMFLMSKCLHNIVANSSFSWWGAWLNNNSEKIVIAPRQWFQKKEVDSPDIVPLSWTRI